jgi:hypothetical protein
MLHVGCLLFVALAIPAFSSEQEAAFLRPHGTSGSGDYLKVKTISPAEIRFCLEVFSSKGHVCNLSGNAKRSPDATGTVYTYHSDSDGSDCTLELELTSTAWIVRDKSHCAQKACGAGLGIGVARFLLRQKTKIRPCIDEDQ